MKVGNIAVRIWVTIIGIILVLKVGCLARKLAWFLSEDLLIKYLTEMIGADRRGTGEYYQQPATERGAKGGFCRRVQ